MDYYELHLHTQESSRCARDAAADMVAVYARKGFAGIAVTDHFMNRQSYAMDISDWRERVDAQLKGYRAAREAGDAIGFPVFCGWEFTYLDNAEDYVTLGLSPDFLYANEGCDQWDIGRYAKAVHDAGGIIIRAHPFRKAWYITQPFTHRAGIADAIEVYNAGNSSEDENESALAYAREQGLPMTAGSDAHGVEEAARGYIGLNSRAESYAALCEAIKKGEITVLRAHE